MQVQRFREGFVLWELGSGAARKFHKDYARFDLVIRTNGLGQTLVSVHEKNTRDVLMWKNKIEAEIWS